MSIDAVMSGLFASSDLALALARAARLSGPAATAASGAADSVAGCTCGQQPCNCGAAPRAVQSIEDRVELSPAARAATTAGEELSDEDQERVEELEARDRAVRDHEAAHLAAAGSYASGGASFEYETGPDGKRYAVGGEVEIDTSPVEGDPAATISKMETVRAAALAPAEPSAQDRSVAAQAAAAAAEARRELSESSGAAQESQPAPSGTYNAQGRSAGDSTAAREAHVDVRA
jgi:hypothetical protein